MQTIRRRLTKSEEGFTLIELMVVVLIIAILIAIAIPTFLGAQDRARDRGAQSDLRNALTAAKTIATDDAGRFVNVTVTSLTAAEGALTFDTVANADEETIGVAQAADEVLFVKRSDSGTWFALATQSDGSVISCRAGADDAGPTAAVVANYAGCLAANDEWA